MKSSTSVETFEQGKAKEEALLTSFDKFVSLTYRLFSRPATRLSVRMPSLRKDIQRSNMRTTPEGLISVAMFSTIITAAVTIPLTFILVDATRILFFYFLPVAIPMVFLLVINMPKASSSSRAAALNNELPFILGYMSILAGGGVSPMAAFRRISQMDLLPASEKEAKRILIETDVFGQDPITAMENVSRSTPSRPFSEFLVGYTAILKTGGNLEAYVSQKLKDTVAAKGASIKRSSDITGTLAESYLTVTVVLGMTLYTLDMIQVLLSHSNAGLVQLYFFAFLIIPIISAAFIFLLDSTAPKWPYTDYRPMKPLAYTIPIAVVIFFIPLPIPLYLHTAIALISSVIYPAFLAIKYSRERRSLERVLPDFIRDVAEGRKTGLSPEKAIERLSTRPYGPLSPYVAKMGSQLSWGIELSGVVKSFTTSVASWIARVIGTLLVEVVDVGGGTVRSFSEMADFSRSVSDMENDRRASLRPFIVITYIAGVMTIVSTFIMVYMLQQPGSLGFAATVLNKSTIDNLLTTAVFDTFIIGLVAGKMGESSLSDGFKHAILLTTISVIAVLIFRSLTPGCPSVVDGVTSWAKCPFP